MFEEAARDYITDKVSSYGYTLTEDATDELVSRLVSHLEQCAEHYSETIVEDADGEFPAFECERCGETCPEDEEETLGADSFCVHCVDDARADIEDSYGLDDVD